MIPDNNIWQLAEAHLEGTLGEQEAVSLSEKLATDPAFAAAFQESCDLLGSLHNSGRNKQFRDMLKDVQAQMQQEKSKAPAKRIFLSPSFWRTAAVAASIAIITSLTTMLVMHQNQRNVKNSVYKELSKQQHDINSLKYKQAEQDQKINKLQDSLNGNYVPSADVYRSGTGFAITNNGYFVTNFHVINGADSVYIRLKNNRYYKAYLVADDERRDIALMKVERSNGFHFSKSDLPYTFMSAKAALGLRVYTLGFPGDDIVYNEGYISSRNGYNGDSNQYRLDLPADPGQSGAPVLDESGNVIAVVTANESEKQSVTYAIGISALNKLLRSIPKEDMKMHLPKTNKLTSLSRTQQIEKLQDYTFMVQVYKKNQ